MEEKSKNKTDMRKNSIDMELDLGLEKRLIGIKEFPVYNSNPFVKDMIKIKDKSRNRIISVTKSPIGYTGNMEEGQQQAIFAHTQKKVDSGEFIKIFTQHIKEWFGLTKPSLRVFYYLLSCLRMNNDEVFFSLGDCMAFTGMKAKGNIYRALGELMDARIIARTVSHNIFYINPAVAFNGDRMVIVNDYISSKHVGPVTAAHMLMKETVKKREINHQIAETVNEENWAVNEKDNEDKIIAVVPNELTSLPLAENIEEKNEKEENWEDVT